MIARELSNLAAAAAAFAAILAAAECARRRLAWPTEWTRKLVHVLAGLVAAAFPWLFASAWTVAVLGAGFAALMAITRRCGWLPAVHAVARRTHGGTSYPLAVVVTFLLARGRPEAYVASILVLALGDAAAALVGRAVGATRYRVLGASRSLEGSLAMLACAYPCVYLPLAWLTSLDPVACAFWSLQVAVLATLVEALAPAGSDNFAVPVVSCLALLGAAGGRGWLL